MTRTNSKVQGVKAMPHQLSRGVQASRDNAIRAIQANFDHLMGLFEEFERRHNELVDVVNDIAKEVEDLYGQTVSA